jgi:hypothetical protein
MRENDLLFRFGARFIDEFIVPPEPLPSTKLCNSHNSKPNPIHGDGPLGKKPLGRNGLGGLEEKKMVELVQMMLGELGYDVGLSGLDGKFGPATEKAVKEFQKNNLDWDGKTLKNDGLVGPKTADALNRALVGIWYEEYKTPEELTDDFLFATLTEDEFKLGIRLNLDDIETAKVALVRPIEYTFTLLDAFDEGFSFDGEGNFKVLDKLGNLVAEGKAREGEDIKFSTTKIPFRVKLSVNGELSTFDLFK